MQPATRLAQLVEDRIGMQAVLSSQRIETLLDEYATAAALDPRRARLVAGAILDEAERSEIGRAHV